MGSNLSDEQADVLVEEFEAATFILDPDQVGDKLKAQLINRLLPRFPIRVVRPGVQLDTMTEEEIEKALA